jgi:hypothetical protein
MHAATVGRFEQYEALCVSLHVPVPDSSLVTSGFALGARRFIDGLESLGIAVSSALEDDLQRVQESMQNPGSFMAFTHRDACPDNNHYDGSTVRLFDFEFGGFRHALLDGAYGRFPFPTCWCVNRLPAHVPGLMESAYRRELAKGCPEANNDSVFNRALVEACALWLINTTSGAVRVPAVWFEFEDQTWGISTIRQRVLMRFDVFASTTEEFGHLEALGSAARVLGARLRELWPDVEEMPLYPAFR